MKRKYIVLFLPFVLLYCTTNRGLDRDIPSLGESTVQEIEEKLTSSDTLFEAIQDISFLERESKDVSAETIEGLYKTAFSSVEKEFNTAIEEEDYRVALTMYRSAATLGIEAVTDEWNSDSLTLKLAYAYKEKGKVLPALNMFRKIISSDEVTIEDLILFGQIAVEEQHRSMLEEIVKELTRRKGDIPEEQLQFLQKPVNPAGMLKGTVTVWVNRGLRIEKGLGYPDRVIGSGFFIDKRGYILTNYHVIASEVDPEYEGYSRLYIKMSESVNDRHPAKVVGYDRIFDIALLKVEMTPSYVFDLDTNEKLEPGAKIFAIGSPAGLENTITSGIISAVERRFLQMGDTMQVDVPINPGNSGGPLLNENGRLIGVVFAGIEQFEGINFAIPSHWVEMILPDLYDEGDVVHSWLGAAMHDTDGNLEIMYTLPGEPAARGGMVTGDIIRSIDGREFTNIRNVQQYFISLGRDAVIEIIWGRDGKEYSGYFTLADRPYNPMEVAIKRDRRDNLFLPLFGMEIEETKAIFLDKSYTVKRVYKGTVADETGISVNDPLKVKNWQVDAENSVAALQIYIKKRKAGFMESIIQLAAYLEIDSFI